MEQEQNNEITAETYVEAIKKLKSTMIPKEEYEKMVQENKTLLNGIINNTAIVAEPEQPEPIDVQKIRNKINSGNLNNLEFAQSIVSLRKAIIESGKPDPFLPVGRNIAPEENDIHDANKVADLLEHCIEYANGNSNIFTDELQRHLVDLPRPRK